VIFQQPHYRYLLRSWHPTLDEIEQLVPGVLAWARFGRRKIRVGAKLDDFLADSPWLQPTEYEVFVPVNAGYLVEHYLTRTDIRPHQRDARYIDGMIETPWGTWSWDDMVLWGTGAMHAMVQRGELKPKALAEATDYQRAGICWAQRPAVMNTWPAGSGKSLGAILQCLTLPGPVLFLTPAKARHSVRRDVLKYSSVEPYVMLPESERRKDTPTLTAYLADRRAKGQRPFVIVGSEALRLYVEQLRQINPVTQVWDEIHMFGDGKRWKMVQMVDGTADFQLKTTAKGNQKLAIAAMEVSRFESTRRRIGLSATPLDDGRPRRLWAQYDLLWPGGFGSSFSRFVGRHCRGARNDYSPTGYDDKGATNLEELRGRASFFMHEVTYSQSHGQLPPTRVDVEYLSKSELNRADRYDEGNTYGQAQRALAKRIAGAGRDPMLRRQLTEMRLAEACSRKRLYVINETIEGLQGGGKVVIFTARRADAELWAVKIRDAVKKGDRATRAPVYMVHGGVSDGDKNRAVDAFRESDGPIVLVATGQSVGVGVDGLQTATLAIFAMLPWRPGDFVQWKGRFDRLGGVATLLKVVIAQGTYDEEVVMRLVDKFGPIEEYLTAEELSGVGDKLMGMDNMEALLDNLTDLLTA
tara:strand:+ start:42518 stop:44434 length:1917 start_codon:yes stop_codon:yes gene_type:complete